MEPKQQGGGQCYLFRGAFAPRCSILNRKPTEEETKTCLAEIRQAKEKTPDFSSKIPADASPEKRKQLLKYYAERAKKKGYAPKSDRVMTPSFQGLAWTLLNTRQFSFIQ